MRAGQDREADDVDVLLLGGIGDHLRRLAQAGVDHLEALVAQPAGEDLGAAIVAVEARLGDQDADGRIGHAGPILATRASATALVRIRREAHQDPLDRLRELDVTEGERLRGVGRQLERRPAGSR